MKISSSFARWSLKIAVLPLLLLVAGFSSPPQPGSCCDVEWGYHGAEAPGHWAELSPCYKPCNGGEQSPIDIVNAERATLPPLDFSYGKIPGLAARNNGHTVQVDIPASAPGGSVTLRIGAVSYRLTQFHFHAPSEHKVKGVEAPLEMHLVHAGPGGRLAVVGVFVHAGAASPELAKVFKDLPKKKGEKKEIGTLDLAGLLPADRASYRYAGSLTTPACGQGVQWNVLAGDLKLTEADLRSFRALFSGPEFPDGNRRPVQPLNGRVVVTDVKK